MGISENIRDAKQHQQAVKDEWEKRVQAKKQKERKKRADLFSAENKMGDEILENIFYPLMVELLDVLNSHDKNWKIRDFDESGYFNTEPPDSYEDYGPPLPKGAYRREDYLTQGRLHGYLIAKEYYDCLNIGPFKFFESYECKHLIFAGRVKAINPDGDCLSNATGFIYYDRNGVMHNPEWTKELDDFARSAYQYSADKKGDPYSKDNRIFIEGTQWGRYTNDSVRIYIPLQKPSEAEGYISQIKDPGSDLSINLWTESQKMFTHIAKRALGIPEH